MVDPAELRRQEYVGRINRAIDYVRKNIAGDLRLKTVARLANFSPYHFHRVFKSVVGETLNDYVRRLRAQLAAAQLIYNPAMTISEIGAACGYSSSSAFAREFRQRFGASASEFRAGEHDSLDRFRQQLEEAGAEFVNPAGIRRVRTDMVFRIQVREEPKRHVAYIRHVGNYSEVKKTFARLMRWAGPRRLLHFPDTQILAIYHDNPDVTPVNKLHADACITVPVGTKVRRDMGTMALPGGTYAVAYVEIGDTQFGEAWDRLFTDWLPQSGYQPDDRPCYELYLNDPRKHPQKKHLVEICEPVRPL